MTQELELYPEEEASKDVRDLKIQQGQQIEKLFKKEIPEQFYKQIEESETEIQNANMVFSQIFGKHVTLTYETLRNAKIPAASAKEIVIGRFIKYRSEGRIRYYIPDEAKNKGRQKGAEVSNAKQNETKDKVAEEAIVRNLPASVKEHIKKTRAESGHDGGMTTLKRYQREHMRKIGSTGGSAERTTKQNEDISAKVAITQYQAEHADEIVSNTPL